MIPWVWRFLGCDDSLSMTITMGMTIPMVWWLTPWVWQFLGYDDSMGLINLGYNGSLGMTVSWIWQLVGYDDSLGTMIPWVSQFFVYEDSLGMTISWVNEKLLHRVPALYMEASLYDKKFPCHYFHLPLQIKWHPCSSSGWTCCSGLIYKLLLEENIKPV